MKQEKQRGKRRFTVRFYINIALFVTILGLGLIFRDQYVALRSVVRDKAFSAAEYVVTGVRTGGLFRRTDDPGIGYGADTRPVTGAGVQVDESAAERPPTNTGEEYRFSQELYPYRAMLNTDAQRIYNQVYAHALVGDAKPFTLVLPTSEDALQTVMSAVYNDHPELFWVDTAYSFGYIGSGDVVTVTLSFNETASNLPAAKARFDETVNALIQGASQYGNNVDKEKYVHDYLVEHVEYDTGADMHQSAYSALVLGKSVCAGYARAFQHVLLEIGIPCYYATGTAAGGSHAWNIVSINGDYYNVDLSWDDASTESAGKRSYPYFNMPDAAFGDHARDELTAHLPACNSVAMSYRNVYGNGSASGETVSANTTYESLGYTKDDVIGSMSAYNGYCMQRLLQLGTGTHVLTMVLKDQALYDRVCAAAKDGSYVSGYAQTVVNRLKLQNAQISLKLQGASLADGYILLTQTVTMTGSAPTATPFVPTPRPTAEPTPHITPSPTPTPSPIPLPTAEVTPTIVPLPEPTAVPESTETVSDEYSAQDTPAPQPEETPLG